MNKIIEIPFYISKGISPAKRGFPKKYEIIVCDTETTKGNPYSLQFYDGKEITLIRVTPKTIFGEFMNYLSKKARHKGTSYILFFHNMPFDISAILCERPDIFAYNKSPSVVYMENGQEVGRLGLFTNKTWSGRVKFPNKKTINLVDTANFIHGSLYNISRQLGLDHMKPERPRGVTDSQEDQSYDDPEFKAYIAQEILCEYDLAEYIIEMHKEYDVAFGVSSSNYAAKVFKKHYLKDLIPPCPDNIRYMVEQSLHGGRASTFLSRITIMPDVKLYDYNSFYPWAMTQIPPLTKGEWVRTKSFDEEYEGFYTVSGYVETCRWPVILKSIASFHYANGEYVKNIPISSYELREALSNGEFSPEVINGWIWKPEKDSVNPFKDYVHDFYEKKSSTPKDDPKYVMYKLLLNQLYGKTYQTIPVDKCQETPDYDATNGKLKRIPKKFRAGGIYLPHAGAWTTSLCRAQLHDDLHNYEALMCATDSFLTTHKAKTGNGLGDLKLECEGLGLIIRPKMYYIFSNKVQEEVKAHGDLKEYLRGHLDGLEIGTDIVKHATHGFWADPKLLLELYVNEETDYSCQHMTKIKESLKQHKQPRVMEEVHRKVNIDWDNEVGFCGIPKKVARKEKELCSANCFICAYREW